MNSDTFIIWLVTVLYIGQACINVYNGNNPQGLILAGYCIANLGLIWTLT